MKHPWCWELLPWGTGVTAAGLSTSITEVQHPGPNFGGIQAKLPHEGLQMRAPNIAFLKHFWSHGALAKRMAFTAGQEPHSPVAGVSATNIPEQTT